MVTDRLEVRLDEERRKKLDKLVEWQDASISEIIRGMIDRQYEDAMRQRRIDAARRLGEMEVEDVPDPDELNRQLGQTYDIGDLH